MFSKRNQRKKIFKSEDNRGHFYESMKAANEAWKEHLRREGVCKERIVFDSKDGLPVNQITVRRNLPFVRYAFKSMRRLEKALGSISFIIRPADADRYISLKDIEIGYYFNEFTDRWELFLWGRDMDRTAVQECEQACERNRGNYISSYSPPLGEVQKLALSPEIREKVRETVIQVPESAEAEDQEFTFKGMEPPIADIKRVLSSLEIRTDSIDTERRHDRIVVGEQFMAGEPLVRFGNYRVNEAGYSGSFGHDIQFSGGFKRWDLKDKIRFDPFKNKA